MQRRLIKENIPQKIAGDFSIDLCTAGNKIAQPRGPVNHDQGAAAFTRHGTAGIDNFVNRMHNSAVFMNAVIKSPQIDRGISHLFQCLTQFRLKYDKECDNADREEVLKQQLRCLHFKQRAGKIQEKDHHDPYHQLSGTTVFHEFIEKI